MKQELRKLLLLCTTLPLVLSAQSTLNEHYNLPHPGDRIIKQQVAYKSLGNSGVSVQWDLQIICNRKLYGEKMLKQ